MGSNNNNCNINFGTKSFGIDDGGGGIGGSGRPPGSGNFGLARQSSIYSLTFDEFQNTLGGMGKDFGSMNMDELLKNIWSAEETQFMATGAGAGPVMEPASTAVAGNGQDGGNSSGYLQRQGSLTLPRTLSQKTVDEVWKDIAKEWNGGKDSGNGSSVPQKQATLKEITLEEFLVRAGVVKEDTQLIGKPNTDSGVGIFGNFTHAIGNSNSNNNSDTTNMGLGISFQQPLQSPNLPLNVNGVRTSQQQQQPPLYPKQANVSYASTITLPGNPHLGGPGMRGGMVGLGDPGMSGITQGGPGMGMVGLGSPAGLSSDGIGRSNGDSSSVSPVPYMFNGGFRGRKGMGTVDKVVERRQRRMIKNRESAARSRARKQAYTMELEQEVQNLKEENEELRKKQAEIMEMQKNQVMEMMSVQSCSHKKLRRTQTGLW